MLLFWLAVAKLSSRRTSSLRDMRQLISWTAGSPGANQSFECPSNDEMGRIVTQSIVEMSYSLDGSTGCLPRRVYRARPGCLFGALCGSSGAQENKHARTSSCAQGRKAEDHPARWGETISPQKQKRHEWVPFRNWRMGLSAPLASQSTNSLQYRQN